MSWQCYEPDDSGLGEPIEYSDEKFEGERQWFHSGESPSWAIVIDTPEMLITQYRHDGGLVIYVKKEKP